MIRNALYICSFSVLTLGLTGCESMKAMGDKITSIDVPFYGDLSEIAAAEGDIVMASTEGCPQVAVVEDLKNLTQFETPSAPTPGTKISGISITGIESACNITEKTVAVDIGLRFDGQLGPQASEWKTPSRSFAYPYFIAVTTPAGDILSKEVFAATIRYDSGDLAITQEEKIRQVIPLREGTLPAGYEILVGFQLTDDELSYARMMAAQPVAITAAPETPAVVAPKATPAPVFEKKAEQPVPTTTDDSMNATPTAAEVREETSTPVTQTTAPAESVPASTPVPAEGVETVAPVPVVSPYAPPAPQMQVIKIKPDGTVETEKK